MIEVKHLTKLYTSRNGQSTTALDDVSFTLPDAGMIFVVGKSGCGKSTLLNLLGGLDTQTAGDVVVEGQAFGGFTPRDFDSYRNDYLGFVFQDYYLIESLTVAQNVMLPLQLQHGESDERVSEILKIVDMERYADRYPKQLSGGQCQRVAVARALVKNPKLILADEPTGNLDSKSGKQILTALKEYSKQHLVLIVSHNREDADVYADRIIELADGRVVSDMERNPRAKTLSVKEDEIVMPKGIRLTSSQLARVNARLLEGKPLILRQPDDKFVPTKTVAAVAKPSKFTDHSISRRGAARLFAMFTRKQMTSLVVTMLLVICLVTILGIGQMFLQFDSSEESLDLLSSSNMSLFAMQKGYASTDGSFSKTGFYRTVRIDERDIQRFRDAGYYGKIYKMYNVSLVTAASDYTLEKYKCLPEVQNYAKFFCKTGNGVLVCDRQYLERIYGNDRGELEVLSGDIDGEGVTEGVDLIVTDYFADSILKRTSSMATYGADIYAALTNGKVKFNRYRIGAVINTRYKERYADLLQMVADGASADDLKALPSYCDLIDELSLTLNTAYNFNERFAEDITDYDKTSYIYFSYLSDPTITFEGKQYSNGTFYCARDEKLKAGQVKLCKSIWRSVTGLNKSDDDSAYWNSLKGKKVTFTVRDNATGEPLTSVELEIVDFVAKDGMRVSVDTLRELRKYDTVPFALYFDDTSDITNIYNAGDSDNFYVPSMQYMAVQSVAGAVKVFKDFFLIIVAVLYVICAVVLVSFGVRSIRKNIFEIGVLRAMGTKTHYLAIIFALQMVMLGLIVCIFALGGMYLGVRFGNAVLVKGFVAYTGNPLAGQLTIIRFRKTTALVGAALVLALSVIASVVPVVSLRRIKPRQIIVSKD